ncbi:hypothetical protein [Helicobacter zhangjianzhongii]|uniref:Uncharacterized protein n=1 Tax=Helicobacter zhangjianzhongii TaxID=2974574 RepID=A0ACC6FTM5_9HELI|nr:MULTISPECIES: hypothetical protein [unclassified Helicobacter]MDL0080691.1 hypothetical protein [Helicobacter sp. CPD2-1]MDL0082629.1 hypothetical protein [Helicobacter sp. XJK30-2]
MDSSVQALPHRLSYTDRQSTCNEANTQKRVETKVGKVDSRHNLAR